MQPVVDLQGGRIGWRDILGHDDLWRRDGEHALLGRGLDDTFRRCVGQAVGIIGHELRILDHRTLAHAACMLGILYSITQPLITRIEGIEATGLGATGVSIDIGRVVVIDQRHIEHAGFHIASGCAGVGIIAGCKHRHGGHERQASGNSQSFHWAISILELFDIHVSCNTLLTDQAS